MSENNFPTEQVTNLSVVESWLVAYLADILEIETDKIEVNTPIEEYGLDSKTALGMIADLEDEFDCEIDPSLVYESPTIQSLSLLVEPSS